LYKLFEIQQQIERGDLKMKTSKSNNAININHITMITLGHGMLLMGLITAMPQIAKAEPIKKIEIPCVRGTHYANVDVDTVQVFWLLKGCICWNTIEEAKKHILSAAKQGVPADYEEFQIFFSENETIKTRQFYCYSTETFNALRKTINGK
jgi:hypothetical protein